MKISYNWLSELTSITLGPKELAERLTMAGLAVDSIERVGDDHILDFDMLSNRPDLLSHAGVAREAALICGAGLVLPARKVKEIHERASDAASVRIDDPVLCPRYAARIIRGVKVGPSPNWLVSRLEAIGQRSVNKIADITNYVMFEMGQPTHAFDLDKLQGKQIVVRRSRRGEQITTLDGFTRELSPEMLIIADANRPVAVAGVMGGEETEISSATKDVLLESAYFNPASVRQTARALGLDTEASYRFERGADFQAQPSAADRVAQLIEEISGGQVLSGVIDVYPAPIKRDPVTVRVERIKRLTGLSVDAARVIEILSGLDFEVEVVDGGNAVRANPPSFRVDISREVDLVEEVARHVGYDLIDLHLPAWSGAGTYRPGENRRRDVRGALVGMGFDEAISYSFVNGEQDSTFIRGRSEPGSAGPLALTNPIDISERQMRTSLLAGLLQAVQTNFNHGQRDVKLFELGRVFQNAGAEQRPIETESLALAVTGSASADDWRQSSALDFYDLKGFVEGIFDVLNISGFTFRPASVEYLHPGQSALLVRDEKTLACFGRVHPRLASFYKFRQPVLVAELEFEELLQLAGDRVRYSGLPRLPATSRDVSMSLESGVLWRDIEEAVRSLGIEEIASVGVFDVYTGKGIPEGMRSLAFRVVYRSQSRTLTDEEVDGLHSSIREMLERRFGAQLR
jgi:phenylalanyl-tRNA synthetase beta chain